MGEGQIRTIRDGKLHRARLWYDKKVKKSLYDDDLLEKTEMTSERAGTEISIRIMNEKMKVPEYEKLKEQVSKHYAFSDINSSTDRKIKLIFEDIKRSAKTTTVSFVYPEGQKLIDTEVTLPSYGDKVKIKIFESPIPLDFRRNDPFGLAGILIKTKGAILDNQLFRFDNEPAALYFFGEAICKELEQRLRKGETEIIDFNRGGLEWDHEYCRTLSMTIEKILEPLILEKKKALEKEPERSKRIHKKMLRKLCSLLNELARQELEEIEGPVEPTLDIENLVIKPEIANIQLDKPRVFSIYAPDDIIKIEGQKAYIKSDNLDIYPLASEVQLERDNKYPQIWYRYFKVVGRREGAEGFIEVRVGSEIAKARIKVAPPKEREKGKISGRKGGFVSDILSDEMDSPPQRVFYDNGIIKIYGNFNSGIGKGGVL